jgi:hypothetical protein
MEPDEAYYARRALEERAAAERATSELAREVHLALAEAYESRSAAARLSPVKVAVARLNGLAARGPSRKPGTGEAAPRVRPTR